MVDGAGRTCQEARGGEEGAPVWEHVWDICADWAAGRCNPFAEVWGGRSSQRLGLRQN